MPAILGFMRLPNPLRWVRSSPSARAHGESRRLDRRASWTAQVCAAQRAAETMHAPSRRHLEDPYSRHFVSHPALRVALAHPLAARIFIAALGRSLPGVHDFVVLRVRYLDDILDKAIADGIDQIVLLGAGFDTTSVRWQQAGATIFEVDAPSTQRDKRATTERLLRTDHAHKIVWVPCDFETDALSERLRDSGFDPARRSMIAWIGVTMFLSREAIDTTLTDLAALCAPASQLVFDYIDPAVVSGHNASASARRVARTVAESGEPYRTGFTTTDIDAVLTGHGFRPCDHAATPELQQRYSSTRTDPPNGKDWLTILTAQRVS
jgi:methyltransferase (TIGR00027 family)